MAMDVMTKAGNDFTGRCQAGRSGNFGAPNTGSPFRIGLAICRPTPIARNSRSMWRSTYAVIEHRVVARNFPLAYVPFQSSIPRLTRLPVRGW